MKNRTPIIQSLLDTDLYKFTMQQVVLHQHPGAEVEYAFRCRTPGIDLASMADEIRDEIESLGRLSFQEDEIDYMAGRLPFLKRDYLDFLRIFRLNPGFVKVTPNSDRSIDIRTTGPWLHTILFEMPVLSIVSEVYYRNAHRNLSLGGGIPSVDRNMETLKSGGVKFADFGTRRRFSFAWHQAALERVISTYPEHLAGTSNVYFAKKFGITPIGTMAHEYLQAYQALGPRLIDFQKAAFEGWVKEYRGELGIALTDVVGDAACRRDFDRYFCLLFDGVRHDSGDPVEWGENWIRHYEKNRVDPKTKSLIFSDGLTFDKAVSLHQHFNGRVRSVHPCIGTNFTNDVGIKPINIVMKMVRCNGQPVAKLADVSGKGMCEDQEYMDYLRRVHTVDVVKPSLDKRQVNK